MSGAATAVMAGVAVVWSAVYSGMDAGAAEGAISFNRDIQPVLSEYCYQCHGPDSASRKPKSAPLRLDRERYAFEVRGDGKPVILKGDPANSELMRRIRTTDPDEVMPPADMHKVMKPEEVDLLERWIASGAEYEEHWAFLPPVKPEVPAVAAEGMADVLTEVDRFIVSRLEKEGLGMNPPEDPARLLRRLSFDLTGLPPSPEDVQAFVANPTRDAYERMVDRLLDTEASAEHFARQWLDVVRYGDTHGIHIDNYRSIWPYRDWVIAAFRRNMPFDRFTIEQMAGDLLPGATLEQRIASGYNRCLPTTGEGGAIPEEYDAIYAQDRVDTAAAAWLGLTTGCASCHDHKFDPITMKDFYSLAAFFRNNTMPAMDGNNAEHPPVAVVPPAESRARWEELGPAIAAKEEAIRQRREGAREAFVGWLADIAEGPMDEATAPVPVVHFPLNEKEGPARGTAAGKPAVWPAGERRKDGPGGPAPVVSGGPVTGEVPEISRGGRASWGAWVQTGRGTSGAVIARMDAAHGFRGWDLYFSDGRPMAHVIDHWPDRALKIAARNRLRPGWHHLMVVFDGSRSGAEALVLFVDGERADTVVEADNLGPDISVDTPLRFGARSNGPDSLDSRMADAAVQDVRIFGSALTPEEVRGVYTSSIIGQYLALPEEERSPEKRERLYELYLTAFDEPSRQLRAELAALESERAAIRAASAVTLVMEEKSGVPEAYILARGDYRNPTEKVLANVPEVLPPLPGEGPFNRLDLAKWLVDRSNPLTARVTVNRVWQYLFGTGIVETPGDFGVMGARPTHPDLLDWLAIRFMDTGWNYRQLVKDLVMTATYRQSARVTPGKLERDPLNRLLARGPRFRLDAEEIRDGALAASGLLVAKVGGPPVRPYQPEGVWEAVAMKESNTRNYVQDTGENLYRRSMYTLWKRTAPPASMDILNAPSREVTCTRRDRTNTPLQAFVTMNDPQFVEASRVLASRAMAEASDADATLDFITFRLIARRLTAEERAIVKRTFDRALAEWSRDPEAAKALLSVGESAVSPDLPAPELAAWTLVASQVMNMDEALTR